MQKLSGTIWNPTPRRAAPDLAVDHSLQVDGGFSDDVSRGMPDEVPSTCEGGHGESSGGMSPDK